MSVAAEKVYHAAGVKRAKGGVLFEVPREGEPEWVERARTLRRRLWSYQRIADELGVSYRMVYKQLNHRRVTRTDKQSRARSPEAVAWARWREKESRRKRAPFCTGVGCGKRLAGPLQGRNGGPPLCTECRIKASEERRAIIAGLWLAGHTSRQIAEVLGDADANSIGTTVSHMREDGWDLPYRRPGRRPAS